MRHPGDAPHAIHGLAWQRLEPPQRRQRILEAVTELLVRVSDAAPLVITIEDLQWCDSETLAVLDLLVEHLPASRILLVVTYRPGFEDRWRDQSCHHQVALDQLPAAAAADGRRPR